MAKNKSIAELYSNLKRSVQDLEEFTTHPEKKKMSGDDVTRMTTALPQALKDFNEKIADPSVSDSDFKKYYSGYKSEIMPAVSRLSTPSERPEVGKDELNPVSRALEKNFQAFQMKDAPKVNTNLSPRTDTQSELFSDLLSKNNGVAVAENHTNKASREMLIREMPNLAKNGVKNFYVEVPAEEQGMIDKAQRTGDYKELSDKFKSTARFGVDPELTVKTIKAAHDNGIEVVAIDKNALDKSKERSIWDPKDTKDGVNGIRVNGTNHEWVDNINHQQEKNPGKFVILAGESHLIETNLSHGMVAKAVGAPVIDTEKSVFKDKKGFEVADPEQKAAGVDFTIKGGPFGSFSKDRVDKVIEEKQAKAEDVPQRSSGKEPKEVNPSGKEVKDAQPKKRVAENAAPSQQETMLADAERRKSDLERARELAENNPDAKKAAQGIQQDKTPGSELAQGNKPTPVIADNGRGASTGRTA